MVRSSDDWLVYPSELERETREQNIRREQDVRRERDDF
jgi:hypothetical protein